MKYLILVLIGTALFACEEDREVELNNQYFLGSWQVEPSGFKITATSSTFTFHSNSLCDIVPNNGGKYQVGWRYHPEGQELIFLSDSSLTNTIISFTENEFTVIDDYNRTSSFKRR